MYLLWKFVPVDLLAERNWVIMDQHGPSPGKYWVISPITNNNFVKNARMSFNCQKRPFRASTRKAKCRMAIPD